MLNSLQEIKENPIANRFSEIANAYGVRGVYVNWQPGGLNTGGVYFVCGLDASKFGRDIDMFRIIENERKGYGDICTDARAFRIDGQQPLMVHRHIVNYCQQLDTLQKVYGYFNRPIPEKISPGTVEIMKMTWENFTNTSKSMAARKDYEKMLEVSIATVEKNYDKSSPEYKQREYLIKGYYDTDRGKIYNWAKKHFSKHKNEVSLTHLVNHAGRISNATVTYSHYQAVRDALSKRPDILYNFSDVRGDILAVKDGEGYGSKEKNDRRYYTLHYPSVCSKDIENILHEIAYPEEFHRTIDEVDPYGYGTEHVVVPDDYFNVFRSLCKENGVKLCIDHSIHSTIGGGVPVAFSAKDSAKTFAMLKATVDVYEKDILLKPEQAGIAPRHQNVEEIEDPPLRAPTGKINCCHDIDIEI